MGRCGGVAEVVVLEDSGARQWSKPSTALARMLTYIIKNGPVRGSKA